jgi:hypothetical protein
MKDEWIDMDFKKMQNVHWLQNKREDDDDDDEMCYT